MTIFSTIVPCRFFKLNPNKYFYVQTGERRKAPKIHPWRGRFTQSISNRVPCHSVTGWTKAWMFSKGAIVMGSQSITTNDVPLLSMERKWGQPKITEVIMIPCRCPFGCSLFVEGPSTIRTPSQSSKTVVRWSNIFDKCVLPNLPCLVTFLPRTEIPLTTDQKWPMTIAENMTHPTLLAGDATRPTHRQLV